MFVSCLGIGMLKSDFSLPAMTQTSRGNLVQAQGMRGATGSLIGRALRNLRSQTLLWRRLRDSYVIDNVEANDDIVLGHDHRALVVV
eukprot:2402402-Pyramimonas_sp.AAC.1